MFFISAIEIAARAFGRQTAVLAAMNHRALPRFDLMLLIPLSMNGFVPIVLTLTFISRYGRLSWYIITLSVVTVALSTGSLATKFAEGSMYDGNGQYLLELGDLICGSNSSILQGAINPIKINLYLVSAIYSCCIVCGLWCIAKHISDHQPKGSHLCRALKACKKLPLKITRNRISSKNISALSNGLLLLLWTTCFGYHIYLYRLFYGNNLVSQIWTLGQIIAVTVWVPAVVEFGYIEHSKLVSS